MNKSEVLLKLYRDKSYSCEVPPVYSGNWNEQNWIDWILKTGNFNFSEDNKTWYVDSIFEGETQILTPDGQVEEIPVIKLLCHRYSGTTKVEKDFEVLSYF